ncbi:MAG: FxsA family protein [Pseudomonadota bacterium]
MWLFIAFLAVPLIEIALFLQVGGLIGFWPTMGTVVLTAILGTWLVRSQGLMAITNVKRSFSELHDPTEPLAHGAMILFSGALLLTPGFFTDGVGFALLVPGIRAALFRYLRSKIKVQSFSTGPEMHDMHRSQRPHPSQNGVIDGDYEEVEPPRPPSNGPSGWTKH